MKMLKEELKMVEEELKMEVREGIRAVVITTLKLLTCMG